MPLRSNTYRKRGEPTNVGCASFDVLTGNELNNTLKKYNRKEVKIMSQLKDLTGRIYGYLAVQKRLSNYVQQNGRNRTRWLTLCLLCGKAYIADGSHLLHGDVISCGCLKNIKSAQRMSETKGQYKRNARTTDLKGKIINNHIKVLEMVPSKNRKRTWLCECLFCGTHFEARANHLLRGLIRSCGCVLSFSEYNIREYLNNHNINYKAHYWFDDLRGKTGRPYQFDFAFLDSNNNLIALLEYQGAQHDLKNLGKEFGKQQREYTDQIKEQYCKDHNINLLKIWYYQDLEKELENILINVLHVNSVPSKQEIV